MTLPPLLSGALLLTGLLLLAAALGRRLLLWFRVSPDGPIEAAVLATGLGLGALQTVPFTLLALGAARPLIIRAVLAALALVLLPDLRAVVIRAIRWARKRLRPDLNGSESIVSVAMVLVLGSVFLRAVCPVTDDDGLSYHLTAAVRLLDAGRFTLLPTFTYTNWPIGVESLFLLLLGIDRNAPVGIVQFSFSLIILCAVCLLSRRLFGRPGPVAAAVLMLAYRVFWEEAAQAHVDLGMALFATLSIYSAVRWNEDRSATAWFRLAALFAGLAATTKLTGIWVIAAMTVALALTSNTPQPVRDRFKTAARFAGLSVLVTAPWFVRTWVVTGNPFYPIAYGLFGGPEWTSEGWPRIQRYFQLLTTLPGLAPTPPNLLLARAALAGVGLAIAALVFARTRRSRLAIPGRFAALFTLFIFAGNGYNLRFLLAAYPMVILCGAALFRERPGAVGRAIPVMVCVLSLLLGLRVVTGPQPKLGVAISVATGARSRADYLRSTLPDYPVVEYANVTLPPESRILVGTWEESTAYYRPFALRSNYWLQDSVHYDSPARLESDLRRIGVTHLVFKAMEPEWCGKSYVCDGRMQHETHALAELAARRGTQLFEANGIRLYRLDSKP